MRIMVVLLSVNLFGTERHAVELANALADAGHAVALVVRERPSDPRRLPGYAALQSSISPSVKVFRVGRRLPILGLGAAVLRFRPAIIHAHSERSARWATRLPLGVPVIASNHCGYDPAYDRCDGLICLTEAQLGQIGPRFHGQRFCVGNWVLPHPRPSDERVLALRREWGIAAHEFVVGGVGRLAPEKGFDVLITAFLRAGLPDARLVIVGDGREEARLRALAAGTGARVILTGFRRDIRDLYSIFDVFVLNSTAEPFGLVVLEALDAGLAVIATATGGAREIAARSPLQLIPIGDIDALAAQLRRARAGALPAIADAAAPFRLATLLPRIVDCYRAVAGARARRAMSQEVTIPSVNQT